MVCRSNRLGYHASEQGFQLSNSPGRDPGTGALDGRKYGGDHYTITEEYTTLQGIIVAVQYIGRRLLTLAWYILVGYSLLKLSKLDPARQSSQGNIRLIAEDDSGGIRKTRVFGVVYRLQAVGHLPPFTASQLYPSLW